MTFQKMKIDGAWIHEVRRHADDRGHFEEQFKLSEIESQLNRTFVVRQVNQSTSRRGVIRGIHLTLGNEGQAKYVSCPKGKVWDIVVDVRPESETYGQWDAVELSPENGKSVLISEGLGHAFLSLEDNSIVNYLCSAEYNPSADITFNPLSPELAISFASKGDFDLRLSPKDEIAPYFQKTK